MKTLTIVIGALLVTVGLFCMFTPSLTLMSIGWLLGLMLTLAGISMVVNYTSSYQTGHRSVWMLLLGLITTAVGVLLLANYPLSFLTENSAAYILGAWLLISSALHILEAFRTQKQAGSGWKWSLALGGIMAAMGVYSLLHPTLSAITLAWLIGAYIMISGINLIAFSTLMCKASSTEHEVSWLIAKE